MGIEVHIKEQAYLDEESDKLRIPVDNNSMREVLTVLNDCIGHNVIEIIDYYVRNNRDGFLEETEKIIDKNKKNTREERLGT